MKSIRDWMSENGLVNEDMDMAALRAYHGSSQVDVDERLRRELRPKVERIMDMDEYKSMPKEDLLGKIRAVVSAVVAEVGGTKVNSRGLADKLSDDEGQVNKTRFARMMGSERLDVDVRLRSELKPKLEYIMDMEEYKAMPKAQLEEKLLAVVSQLVAEMKGSTMSLSTFRKRMDTPQEDPVAQESRKLPSFLTWIENNEEQGAVSEPQHEEGEDNMDLKAVVEKRMMQMAMELESDGKGSRQEVLAAMKAVVDSASKEAEQGQEQQQGDSNAQQEAPQADQGPTQTPDQAQMQPQAQA